MPSRYELVSCVRARRIIDAIDCLRSGSTDAEYERTAGEGFHAHTGFYAHHDGSGNHHVIAWSPYGVVALEFDHDGADLGRGTPEGEPGRWLGSPARFDALGARVTQYGDGRATGALWIDGSEVRRHGETPQLDPYVLDVDEALAAWNDVEELSRKDRALVVLLERKSRDKALKLTKAQQQQLLDRGPGAAPATPRGAELAARILGELGIVWPDAKAKATSTRRTTTEKAAELLGAPQVALLTAVYRRDLEATRAALDAGAYPDCKTYKGQFDNRSTVESPLVMATRTADDPVALLLIERGAPMDEIDGVGMHPAMRWAVRRGRVRVVRAMLAAGASVRANDHGNLIREIPGCASMLAEAQSRPFLGTLGDFAECLRVLLDAGASVPDYGSWPATLVRFAEEAGADDLAARLRVKPPNPSHAEHALPAPPPLPQPPSVDAPREAVLDLLRRATGRVDDPIGARTALMGAWRLTRHPRIADAIEVWDGTSGGRDRIARGPSRDRPGAAMIVQGFDSALRLPAQPVDAQDALDFVELSGVGCDDCSDRCVESAAAVLVHVADVRALERLRLAVRVSRANWALFGPPRALTDAIASLATFRFAELDEEASALLARVDDVAAERPAPPTNVVPISDLLRAVQASPDDDAPRRALAERLTAVGDPRGEFITLQLDRDRDRGPSAREEALREHGRAWLGDIGWAVRDAALAFERGFVSRAATGRQHVDLKSWHLGYGAPVKFGDEDEWSTVQALSVGWNDGQLGLLLSPKLRSLREVYDVSPGDLDEVLAGPPRSWTSLGALGARGADDWQGARQAARVDALPDVLPELSSLSFGARDLTGDVVARSIARLSRLRELSLAYRWDALFELVAIGAENELRTVRLLLLRVGKRQDLMRSPGDLAVDVATRVITVEMPGRLHDSVAQGAAAALRNADMIRPTALVLALPPGAWPEGEDPASPDLPEAFVRNRQRVDLAPLWAIGRKLDVPCSVGPELVPHWSPCTDDLDTFTPPRRGDW